MSDQQPTIATPKGQKQAMKYIASGRKQQHHHHHHSKHGSEAAAVATDTTVPVASAQDPLLTSDPQRQTLSKLDIKRIYLAEFDIDKGSIVRAVYPALGELSPYDAALGLVATPSADGTTSYEIDSHAKSQHETYIASQMLPDGSHNAVNDDFTYFFLKTQLPATSSPSPSEATSDSSNVTSSSTNENDGQSSSTSDDGFLYCLNVYKQRQLRGVRRGARVKALAICSPDKNIMALKPVLQKALDRIFDVDQSAQMLDAETEEKIRNSVSGAALASPAEGSEASETVAAAASTAEPVAAAASIVAPVASGETPEAIVESLFHKLNDIDLSYVPVLSEAEKLVQRFTLAQPWHSQCRVVKVSQPVQTADGSSAQPIDVFMPLTHTENEVDDRRISLVSLVERFREKIMILFNAVMYEKRIVFLGYNVLAGDVCCAVLSCCLLMPQLTGLLKTRISPYSSLSDLDFLQTAGFIAGSCNPMFKQRQEWWDCLIDLGTDEVLVSGSGSSGSILADPFGAMSASESSVPTATLGSVDASTSSSLADSALAASDAVAAAAAAGMPAQEDLTAESLEQHQDDICFFTEEDAQFIQKVISLIQTHRRSKLGDDVTLEEQVRSHFRDYSQNILDLALEQHRHREAKMKSIKSQEQLAMPIVIDGKSAENYFGEDAAALASAAIPTVSTPTPGSGSSKTKRSLGIRRPKSNKSHGILNSAMKAKRLRKTQSFKVHLLAVEAKAGKQPLQDAEARVYADIRRLRSAGTGTSQQQALVPSMQLLSEPDLINMYQNFIKIVRTQQQIVQFLSFLPQTLGGIYPVSVALFNPSPAVRLLVVTFLQQLTKAKEGSTVFNRLNMFLQLTFQRNADELLFSPQ